MFVGDRDEEYPKPDGQYFFDKLSSVFASGNKTRDDQPSHIRVQQHVPRELAVMWEAMCPAKVYEVEENGGSDMVDVKVNASNCVQCGAITAKGGQLTPPEGGVRARVHAHLTLATVTRAADPAAQALLGWMQQNGAASARAARRRGGRRTTTTSRPRARPRSARTCGWWPRRSPRRPGPRRVRGLEDLRRLAARAARRVAARRSDAELELLADAAAHELDLQFGDGPAAATRACERSTGGACGCRRGRGSSCDASARRPGDDGVADASIEWMADAPGRSRRH